MEDRGVTIRPAVEADIPRLALLRSEEWGEPGYWEERIAAYLSGRSSPGRALEPRTCFVAEAQGGSLAGFAAGHLTTRYATDGELQWINVPREWRRRNVASALLRAMAEWFLANGASRICVNVEPDNATARAFYQRYGAEPLKPHWMLWKDIRTVRTGSGQQG